MVGVSAATSLQRCKLHQQQLLSARSNLAKHLGELSLIPSKLNDFQSKLLDFDNRLSFLCHAMAPVQSQVVFLSGLARRVDNVLHPATEVLEIFKSIRMVERKLRIDDPRHDLRKYLALVCHMERYLYKLQEAYSSSLNWLERFISFLNHNHDIDKYSLSKLADELEQLKSLDLHTQLMNVNGGGLLNIPFRKLENEFGRLLVDLDPLDTPVDAVMKQHAIGQLRMIADWLRVKGRLDECLHLYKESRGRIVKKSMASLVSKYSSEEARKEPNWKDNVYAWFADFDVVVRVFMASERELCNQVFLTLGPPSESWMQVFAEIVRGSEFVLLFGFAEEVACTQHKPEALLGKLLYLAERMENLKQSFDNIFDGCSETLVDMENLRRTLVHNVCRVFWEFVKSVETRKSGVPNAGGKDQNASSVVKYIGTLLRDYQSTMELAFRPQHKSKVAGTMVEVSLSSAARSMMDALEKNLKDRASKGYNNPVLAHVFLMNNYRHILVCLKEWEGLATCLGKNFNRHWWKKVDHNMQGYLNKAWEKVISQLNREGLQLSSGGQGTSKGILRSRMGAFNAAFEETYKQQCGWVIVDDQLRGTVQLTIIQMLLPAYLNFIESYGSLLDENTHAHNKVIKYSGDRLQHMVWGMFEGKRYRSLSPEENHS